MSRAPSPELSALLCKVEPGQQIIAHMVPTRIIRVIAIDSACCTFRVQQLVEIIGHTPLTPKGDWKDISTHGSAIPWESLEPAMHDGARHQAQLIKVLKARIEARKAAVGQPGMLPGLGGAPLKPVRS